MLDPHDVEVMLNPPGPVIEDSNLTLTCKARGGNPAEVLSYQWDFEPRYEVTNKLGNITDRDLELEGVQYTQAGLYRCEADNGAGVSSGSEDILVHCKYKYQFTATGTKNVCIRLFVLIK